MDSQSYQFKRSKRVLAVIAAAAVTGLFSALVADTLKVITEHYEEAFLENLHAGTPSLVLILPLLAVLLLKPVATSVTLGAGGDGERQQFPRIQFILIR